MAFSKKKNDKCPGGWACLELTVGWEGGKKGVIKVL